MTTWTAIRNAVLIFGGVTLWIIVIGKWKRPKDKAS